MSKSMLRTVLVIAALIIGLSVVYAPRIFSSTPAPIEESAEGEETYTYVTDLDFWKRTPRETTVKTVARFDLDADLNNVPLTVGDWQGEERPETNQEVEILLNPEQYVRRLYQNPEGQYIWLTMIGGRSSRPFHPPDICYSADGWQYDLGSRSVSLPEGGELYGLWLDADKQFVDRSDPTEHVVYYFYLFPDKQRDLSDGIVLFKLTSAQYGSMDETLEMQADFIRNLFLKAE